MQANVLREPRFVGREHVLGELNQFLHRVVAGQGTTVFISGEAGSGKTRLSKEFLDVAKEKGVTVLTGWCLSNSSIPYFPFTEAFESYSTSQTALNNFQGKGLESSLIELNKAYNKDEQPQAWKDRTYFTVTKEILSLSTKQPLILFIDDLHWADSASLALLHYIARAIEAERILLLATFRKEEINAKTDANASPLAGTMRLMGREGLYTEIKLCALSSKETQALAENMLKGKLHKKFVDRLHTESQGNPLFIVESVRLLSKQENLRLERNLWTLKSDEIEVPDKVRDVIWRRLEALTPIQRRIVNAASVIGNEFDPELLANTIELDTIETQENLDLIAKTTLLVHSEGKLYSFNHAKYQEMLYEEIPFPMKATYHLKIAQKLESTNDKDRSQLLDKIAYHYVQAHDTEKAIKYSLLAGQNALKRYSNAEAIKHFSFVLENTNQDHPNELSSALEGLGDAFYASSMLPDAAKTFERLSDVSSGAIKLRALRKAANALFFNGENAHLFELTKKAEPLANEDRVETARIRYMRGRSLINQGRVVEALNDYETALKMSEEEYVLWDVASESVGVGVANVYLGKTERGIAYLLRAVALLTELGDERRLMEAQWTAGGLLGNIGLLQKGSDLVKAAIELAQRLRDYKTLAESYAILAFHASLAGNNQDTRAIALKALECADKTDSKLTQLAAYGMLAKHFSETGELEQAEKYYRIFDEGPEELKVHPLLLSDFTTAIFLAAKNDFTQANPIFKQAIEAAKRGGGTVIEAYERKIYASQLASHGKTSEANEQIVESERIYRNLKNRFKDFKIISFLLVPLKIEINQPIEIRLDFANISKTTVTLNAIEGFLPSTFSIQLASQGAPRPEKGLLLNEKIDAFQVKTITIKLQASKQGTFTLSLSAAFTDQQSRKHTIEIEPKTVTVQPQTMQKPNDAEIKQQEIVSLIPQHKEFETIKNPHAVEAFDFLVKAFANDYLKGHLTLDQSGWRTLNQVVNEGKIPKSYVYGEGRRLGRAIAEIQSRGVTEARIFQGERGRGGRILKIRVDYTSEYVKREVAQRYLKKKEK